MVAGSTYVDILMVNSNWPLVFVHSYTKRTVYLESTSPIALRALPIKVRLYENVVPTCFNRRSGQYPVDMP